MRPLNQEDSTMVPLRRRARGGRPTCKESKMFVNLKARGSYAPPSPWDNNRSLARGGYMPPFARQKFWSKKRARSLWDNILWEKAPASSLLILEIQPD